MRSHLRLNKLNAGSTAHNESSLSSVMALGWSSDGSHGRTGGGLCLFPDPSPDTASKKQLGNDRKDFGR